VPSRFVLMMVTERTPPAMHRWSHSETTIENPTNDA